MEVDQEGTVTGVGWLGAADEGRAASGSLLKGSQWDFLVEMQIKEGRIWLCSQSLTPSMKRGNCH